ncbi:MAG TPA: recombinase family protein [Thermoanaerobaculia bacterium]|nr:recombinase family protein [Thermoanaerobaculia bacterium]
MTRCFAYIRVSTPKQKEEGVSPEEQHDAIARYAGTHGLSIIEWFEETKTAAKRGRPKFTKMLRLLRQGKAQGLVIHKIDRSARNLRDWADLGELIDAGIAVHFVNESLDLHTRGGRLAADIQAIVAADFIRNLREETLKGFYGRLKQGLYPLQAPLGYLDCGKGKPKVPDANTAPHVRKTFELYDSGQFSLLALADEMYRRGLRNRNRHKVTRNGLSTILNNSFYCGLISLRKTGETFPGIHRPLIPVALFRRVQDRLQGRTHRKVIRHEFVFRRLLSCGHCGRLLRGELQKGHVYYRCHTQGCPTKCVREEAVDETIQRELRRLMLSSDQLAYLFQRMEERRAGFLSEWEEQQEARRLRLGQIQSLLDRLVDAYLDGMLEKELLEKSKASLYLERRDLEEKLALPSSEAEKKLEEVREVVELANAAWLSYETATADHKRALAQLATSNRIVTGKNLSVELFRPFVSLTDYAKNTPSDLQRAEGRSGTNLPQSASSQRESALRHIIEEIESWIKQNSAFALRQDTSDQS